MSGAVDLLNPKKILMIASNPTTSQQTGWPIGFWAAELTHPFWKFKEHGYQVDVASPAGGKLEVDAWSDPFDESGYSADDWISAGFLRLPQTATRLDDTPSLAAVNPDEYDAIFLVGGQGPMYTFYNDEKLHEFVASYYEKGGVTAIVCHATCILLKVRKADGSLLVEGKTWTGFADTEEEYADQYVGQPIQPFRIETEARKLAKTNFIVNSPFKAHAVRDGNLITGQQQFSGGAAARLVIEALGQ
jgi:putative intracellular protease/amidase